MTNLFISGITGRMGKELANRALNDKEFKIVGGSCSANGNFVNKEIGTLLGVQGLDIKISSTIPKRHSIDVVVDFSLPEVSIATVKEASKQNLPCIIGTTGFSKKQITEFKLLSTKIPILLSSNTSIGISLMKKMILSIVNDLGALNEIVIKETHHINKVDSPSGTAINLKDFLSKNVNSLSEVQVVSSRYGEEIGEHTI